MFADLPITMGRARAIMDEISPEILAEDENFEPDMPAITGLETFDGVQAADLKSVKVPELSRAQKQTIFAGLDYNGLSDSEKCKKFVLLNYPGAYFTSLTLSRIHRKTECK